MTAGAAAFGVVAAAGLFIGALQSAADATQRFRDAQETATRTEASIRSRFLRATGQSGAADELDRAERNRQEVADLERQRQAQLAATRRRLFTRAQQRKREGEIHDRFNRLIDELLKAQNAEASALGGSIGDYNAPAGLNVAAMIGDIRRATLAAPEVPGGGVPGGGVGGGGVGGGREGLTIVINGPVTTEAKSASEFVRELQSLAQTQYGSTAEWSRVTVMA